DLLLETLQRKDQKIYFLAGKQAMLNVLETKLENEYPNLVFKTHHGYFKKDGKENDAVITDINTFKPHVLFVGFVMPMQEFWINDNVERLDAKVFLPEGASLDFYTEYTSRGSAFLTDNGFEWMSRLVTEPGRLWKRYIIGNPKFFI